VKQGHSAPKQGWDKISTFCRIAREHENAHAYVWVDTSCINKENMAELSEAINSMYEWYSKAAVCFAYLYDVDPGAGAKSFGEAEWFSRGWTLQELIGPTSMDFYDQN